MGGELGHGGSPQLLLPSRIHVHLSRPQIFFFNVYNNKRNNVLGCTVYPIDPRPPLLGCSVYPLDSWPPVLGCTIYHMDSRPPAAAAGGQRLPEHDHKTTMIGLMTDTSQNGVNSLFVTKLYGNVAESRTYTQATCHWLRFYRKYLRKRWASHA